jgi:hypothetical protein
VFRRAQIRPYWKIGSPSAKARPTLRFGRDPGDGGYHSDGFSCLFGVEPALANRDCAGVGRASSIHAWNAVSSGPANGRAAVVRMGSWAWGVNGLFTVIGTVLTLMLGVMTGFRMVLLFACVCYLPRRFLGDFARFKV